MRYRVAAALALLALLTLFIAPAARAAGPPLEEKINIAVEKAKAQDILKTFAQIASFEPAISPKVAGTVSLKLENVRVKTGLDAVCDALDCRWWIESGTPPKLRVEPLPGKAAKPVEPRERKASDLTEPIDIKVTGARVDDLLRTFGQLVGAEVVLDPKLDGAIDIELEATPVREGLDRICERAGCAWSYDASGAKPVLRFTKR